MTTATHIKTSIDGTMRLYETNDHFKVWLIIDMEELTISIKHGTKEFVAFRFKELDSSINKYLILSMDCGQFKGKGLGRAGLTFFKESLDCYIVTRQNDGIVRDDGSHLTNGAPLFVGKMQEEGIIEIYEDNWDIGDDNGFFA